MSLLTIKNRASLALTYHINIPEVALVTILAEPILVISADFVCHFSEIYISFELRNFVASKSRVGTEMIGGMMSQVLNVLCVTRGSHSDKIHMSMSKRKRIHVNCIGTFFVQMPL